MEKPTPRSGKLEAKNDRYILELLSDPKYDVRLDGTIWTTVCRTGKDSVKGIWRMAGNRGRDKGKSYVRITYNRIRLQAHRIIWAKYGNKPLESDLVINHLDGDGTNNNISNLEHVTQSRNCSHSFKTRDPVYGNVKLGWEVAAGIRAMRSLGCTYPEIMKKFGLTSKGQVSEIVNNKVWVESSRPAEAPDTDQVMEAYRAEVETILTSRKVKIS